MNEFVVDSNKILPLINGKDENDDAKAGCAMSLVEYGENIQPKSIQEIAINAEEIIIAENGGCAVVNIRLNKEDGFQYMQICNVLKQIERENENTNSERKNEKTIVLVVAPLSLEGNISLAYTGLTYYEGFVEKNNLRVLMAFDNQQTEAYINEDINYKEIEQEVEIELRREEEELDLQIENLEKEVNETKNTNPYEKGIKETYQNLDFNYGKEKNSLDNKNESRRYTNDSVERRYSEDD